MSPIVSMVTGFLELDGSVSQSVARHRHGSRQSHSAPQQLLACFGDEPLLSQLIISCMFALFLQLLQTLCGGCLMDKAIVALKMVACLPSSTAVTTNAQWWARDGQGHHRTVWHRQDVCGGRH